MRFFLAFFTLSLCLFGAFGTSNSQRRFHYGQESKWADEYFAPLLKKPWFAGLEYKCGGTWIHRKYVLTSALCLKDHDIDRVGSLKGRTTNWANKYDTLDIDGKHYFGNYSLDGNNKFENDIGLVKVRRKIMDYPPHGPGRRLAADPPEGPFPKIFNDWGNINRLVKHDAVMFGFGWTEKGNYAGNIKYMTGYVHFSDDYAKKKCLVPSCKKGHSFTFETKGALDRIDKGDMGNPVYYKLDNPDHTKLTDRVLIGVVSTYYWDPRNIIVTNLTYYQGWIDSIIRR